MEERERENDREREREREREIERDKSTYMFALECLVAGEVRYAKIYYTNKGGAHQECSRGHISFGC